MNAEIRQMELGSDLEKAYFLDATGNTLGRIDLRNEEIDKTVEISPHTQSFCMSSEKDRIYTCARREEDVNDSSSQIGTIQVIDGESMNVERTLGIPFIPSQIVAGNDQLFYLTGTSDRKPCLAAFDPDSTTIVSRAFIIGERNYVAKNPEGSLLFLSWASIRGYSVVALPLRDQQRPDQTHYFTGLAGRFAVSPDGKFLVFQSGYVVSLENSEGPERVKRIERHLASAFAPKLGVVLISTDSSSLQILSYPGFEPLKTLIMEHPIYSFLIDVPHKRVVAAVTTNPPAQGYASRPPSGDIVFFDLAKVFQSLR